MHWNGYKGFSKLCLRNAKEIELNSVNKLLTEMDIQKCNIKAIEKVTEFGG